MFRTLLAAAIASAMVVLPSLAGDHDSWIELTAEHPLDAWRKPSGGWYEAGDARPDPKDGKKLVPLDGRGVIINSRSGRTNNLGRFGQELAIKPGRACGLRKIFQPLP